MTTATASNFVFTPRPSVNAIGLPLDDLEPMVGPWAGTGFNTIWRPHFSQPPDPTGQDRFLELNLTNETLDIHRIHGLIPNRGLDQVDINMRGVHYLQQIADQAGGGLHLEPGIWALVPSTTAPAEEQTVVRMASIPHGTTMLAQGTATVTAGAPDIPDVNILPFPVGGTAPTAADFDAVADRFTELKLSVDTPFRLPEFSAQLPAITQEMVKNPAKVIQDAVAAVGAANFIKTITLDVSTTDLTPGGGGTANTIFLQDKNADASIVSSTFWVSSFKDAGNGDEVKNVLIYSQTVMLDFNGIRWPHVTVAFLKETS